MPSLLVTNDFPPKVGGIQSYLYEIWRRLPPRGDDRVHDRPRRGRGVGRATVVPGRTARQKVLLPSGALTRDVDALAREVGADVIFLDPMLPLGAIGPRLHSAPYVVVAHGAEITVPASVPGLRSRGRRILRGAAAVVAAGGYPARQAARVAGRELRGVLEPPGSRRRTVPPARRRASDRRRARASVSTPARPLVLGLSRLVPAQGIRRGDRRGRANSRVCSSRSRAQAAIGPGSNGAARAVRRTCDSSAGSPRPTSPSLYGCADVFAMCCRERWAGLEAEGFGIVFLEAAACAVPAVAGRSGGAHEAVVDGETATSSSRATSARSGPRSVHCATTRSSGPRMGRAARDRAVAEYSYDGLVARLLPVARGDFSAAEALPR